MKLTKLHYFLITLILVTYGYIFYQKNYAGPDVIDYYRDKFQSYRSFFNTPEKFLNKPYTIYADLHPNGIFFEESLYSNGEFKSEYGIYFKKDQSKVNYKCLTSYIEITGTIKQSDIEGDKYFYYSKVDSIHGFDNRDDSIDKGKKIECVIK